MGQRLEGDPRIDKVIFSRTLAEEEAVRKASLQQEAARMWEKDLRIVEARGYSDDLGIMLSHGVRSELTFEEVATIFLTLSNIEPKTTYGKGLQDVQRDLVSAQLNEWRLHHQKAPQGK
jgi:hypothetical protein